MVILASPNTVGHSPKVRLVVTMTEVRSQSLLMRWMEEGQEMIRGIISPTTELATSLGEGEIAQLVEDDEVEAVQVICQATLFAAAGLGLETIDQINDIVEAASRAVAYQRAGNGDGQM